MLFFALLPSDLHICILQTWIGCDHSDSAGSDGQLLRALSALDIACCSAKHRKPCWLELTASLRFKGMVGMRRFLGFYWHWLSSRAVTVRCLVLDERMHSCWDFPAIPGPTHDRLDSLLFPAVTELIVVELADRRALTHLLVSCPSLTAISSTAGKPFWEILATRPPMRLTALAGTMPEFARAALLVHGQHLLKLELELEAEFRGWDSAEILEVLPQACPALESLSLKDCSVSVQGLLDVLEGCRHLTELAIEAHSLAMVTTLPDLTAACATLLETSSLRRFTIYVCVLGTIEQEQAFVQLRSGLSSIPRTLLLSQHCISELLLVIRACRGAHLAACMRVDPLLKLRLWLGVASAEALSDVLSRCPALESLELSNYRSPDDMHAVCNAVVMHCRQLRALVLDFGCRPSDEEVISLLSGLPCLKELKVRVGDRITFRTLQAIVDSKRCLIKFCCGRHGFPRAEVIKFRQLAKTAGIHPVPWVGPFK